MGNEIQEADIPNLTFISAPMNKSVTWHKKLEHILENGSTTMVMISFSTTTGIYSIRANIISVIEQYVRIANDTIIPLSSITDLDFCAPDKQTEPDLGTDWDLIIIAIITTLIFIGFTLLVVNEFA